MNPSGLTYEIHIYHPMPVAAPDERVENLGPKLLSGINHTIQLLDRCYFDIRFLSLQTFLFRIRKRSKHYVQLWAFCLVCIQYWRNYVVLQFLWLMVFYSVLNLSLKSTLNSEGIHVMLDFLMLFIYEHTDIMVLWYCYQMRTKISK